MAPQQEHFTSFNESRKKWKSDGFESEREKRFEGCLEVLFSTQRLAVDGDQTPGLSLGYS